MNPSIEVVRFRVAAEQAARFVSERAGADCALVPFAGFLGSELAQIDAEHWVLIVRWASPEHAAAAQRVTLSAASPAALTAWIALATEVIGFETATVLHASVPTAADAVA